MTMPADPTPADARALAEEAIRLAEKVPWLTLRTNVERGNWGRYEKHLLLQAAEPVATLARALLAALDEREAMAADLAVVIEAAAELEQRIRAERAGYDVSRAEEIRAALARKGE